MYYTPLCHINRNGARMLVDQNIRYTESAFLVLFCTAEG